MEKDTHKGISGIAYNSLNLPRAIEIANPQTQGRIKYTYSAAGQKLRTVHETDQNLYMAPMTGASAFSSSTPRIETTDYAGNKIYKNNTLDKILVDGGYYDVTKKMYIFYLTDHLGNNIVVADQNSNVLQQTHYYPFGMAFAESTGQDVQPFKYNGKELDQQHQLNLYDYSARYYEAATGRFTTVDPLAEKFYSWSPYVYTFNNPLRFTDPTGMSPEDEDPEKGKRENFWASIMNAFKSGVEGVLYSAGLHSSQIQSDNPSVLADASNKRVETEQTLDAAAETTASLFPGGELGYKVARGKDVETSDVAWAAAEIIPVGKAAKGAKAAKKIEKAIVIGEGMGRVKIAAKSVDAKWYQAWSKNFPKAGELMTESQMNAAKSRNARWLNSKIKEGYRIYDIGVDASRVTRSPFYQLEKDIIKKNNYPTIKLP